MDDCADALMFLLQHDPGEEHLNVGTGTDISIGDLARMVCDVVGFDGGIVRDQSKPDGTPRKLLDTSRLTTLGGALRIALENDDRATYDWSLNQTELRADDLCDGDAADRPLKQSQSH